MENIWIILLFGIALGAGIGIGKGIMCVFNKFIYRNDEEDEENWS